MVVQQVARFGNGFEAGLGAEFANAVSGVIVGNGAVVHTREQMMPEVVQLVFRMGAPVAKEHTIGDWEPKVMGKQPAIFFCVDHEFWLVRDALGPGYRVRTTGGRAEEIVKFRRVVGSDWLEYIYNA